MKQPAHLAFKYNQPVPRYTSYPTVPYWHSFDDLEKWQQLAREKYAGNKNTGISIYIHLPFCESLCTYCGCNKRITTNHSVEEEYMQAILREWQMYCDLIGEKPVIRELHIGGGTPTFFSPANLYAMLTALLDKAIIHPAKEFSFEGHPNNTTMQHLLTLNRLGFTRVSYGVQDNDPFVQRAINRIQPFENVEQATYNARMAGYTSVNFDLIYGLPFQTLHGLEKTFNQVINLKPDRIAFYSYAHVPWKQRAQRLFDETNLPAAADKMQLYQLGKTMLLDAGYTDIGMDHFALPGDDLYKAWEAGTLHRNFMGYTTTHTNYLLGLGVSAISDIGVAYAQNHKELENYYRGLQESSFNYCKGYFLTGEDAAVKNHILNIACRNSTVLQPSDLVMLGYDTLNELAAMQDDGLITIDGPVINVTPAGRPFIRNICYAFDRYRNTASQQHTKMFSMAV
ncbi:MAG TPA: oxygen-independent coproporphyrinogen III oxidase [Chitinophagaceae bacterium]|nr:oxygen-independent coproporphyrinogen III oxidase [Chitinophagaceae bacterium]